jgi:hypothetical protein
VRPQGENGLQGDCFSPLRPNSHLWLTAFDQLDERVTRASAVQVLAERLVWSEQIEKSDDWNQPIKAIPGKDPNDF